MRETRSALRNEEVDQAQRSGDLVDGPLGMNCAVCIDEAACQARALQGLAGSLDPFRHRQLDAMRISIRDSKTTLIDGPFTESKEMVGGFFLLDVASAQEAIEIARQCPAAEFATVEVREVAPCCAD